VIQTVFHNLLGGDLNSWGLLFGFFGAVLVIIFGLPSIPVLSEGSYTEIQVTPTMKRYVVLSRLGLALIAVGFVLQLLAVRAT